MPALPRGPLGGLSLRFVLVAAAVAALALTSIATVQAQEVRLPGTWTLQGAIWQAPPPGTSGLAVHMDTSQGPPFYNQVYGLMAVEMPSGTQLEDVGPLAFDVYYATGSCGGGSPRFQLRVDLDNDGVADKNVFVYPGPFPNFGGCPTGQWLHDDSIQDGNVRWDSTQVGGPFYGTKAQAQAAAGPNHQVLRVIMVWDSEWLTGPGSIYFDNVRVNNYVLDEPPAMLCLHILTPLIQVCPTIEIRL